jgi:hypothetical protein
MKSNRQGKETKDIRKYILQHDKVKNNTFVGVVQLMIIHSGACASIILLTNLISGC